MTKYILPYSKFSKSAIDLARAMDIKLLKTRGSRYVHRAGDVIICWGNTAASLTREMMRGRLLNPPVEVARAVNKDRAFQIMNAAGVSVPQFTNNIAIARDWIRNDRRKVVCRQILDGSKGAGIVIAEREDQVVRAPLYTQYIPKDSEWRVHVVNDAAIATHRKVLRNGVENPNFLVRNSDNGFVFQRNITIPIPQDVPAQAIRAVRALGLDFGAVDVVWNERRQQAYVLEVNTAPGIEGSTITDYARAFNAITVPEGRSV